MAIQEKLSIYLSYLLRHHPEDIELHMDIHGWVDVNELIENINKKGMYTLSFETLQKIVNEDKKGRYRFSEDKSKIKACQGHSIVWVKPELQYTNPPTYLYHGTTTQAFQKIISSGFISKMQRHAVHMQKDVEKAMKSAKRWKLNPVVLKIDAKQMQMDGYIFGVSENEVWCTEKVPLKYIVDKIYE